MAVPEVENKEKFSSGSQKQQPSRLTTAFIIILRKVSNARPGAGN